MKKILFSLTIFFCKKYLTEKFVKSLTSSVLRIFSGNRSTNLFTFNHFSLTIFFSQNNLTEKFILKFIFTKTTQSETNGFPPRHIWSHMNVNSTQIHDFSEGVFQLFAKKMRETGSGEACEASFESI